MKIEKHNLLANIHIISYSKIPYVKQNYFYLKSFSHIIIWENVNKYCKMVENYDKYLIFSLKTLPLSLKQTKIVYIIETV